MQCSQTQIAYSSNTRSETIWAYVFKIYILIDTLNCAGKLDCNTQAKKDTLNNICVHPSSQHGTRDGIYVFIYFIFAG